MALHLYYSSQEEHRKERERRFHRDENEEYTDPYGLRSKYNEDDITPSNKFVLRCEECGHLFTYDYDDDTYIGPRNIRWVKCPNCGEECKCGR